MRLTSTESSWSAISMPFEAEACAGRNSATISAAAASASRTLPTAGMLARREADCVTPLGQRDWRARGSARLTPSHPLQAVGRPEDEVAAIVPAVLPAAREDLIGEEAERRSGLLVGQRGLEHPLAERAPAVGLPAG